MKAIRYYQYGGPEVLQIEEVAAPKPKTNEVLIDVKANSVNPLDWHYMRGTPHFMRVMSGLRKPKSNSLGADIAGIVVEVGEAVNDFKIGDRVFGDSTNLNAFAEQAAVPVKDIIPLPHSISFEQAAGVGVAATTALQGLRFGGIAKDKKVLINGASGGVGTFAVQIAKALGAEVTGVCSTRNLEMVRSLGASQVIDYTNTDFCENLETYDLVFDAVGNRRVADYLQCVKKYGQVVIAGYTSFSRLMHHALAGSWASMTGNKKIGFMPTAQVNQNDLHFLVNLMVSDKIKTVVDQFYKLETVPDAIAYLETSRAKGKVIIQI